jgi:hypothetical protein
LVIGLIAGALFLGVAAVATLRVVGGSSAAGTPTDTPSASAPVATASSAPEATASAAPLDAGPQAFDIEAISHPVVDPPPSAAVVEADNSGLGYKGPEDKKPKPAKVDAGAASTWKPPPVLDPGF